MADLDDFEDIIDDPEDIVEELFEIDDLLETALSSPGTIIASLAGVLGVAITLLGLVLTFFSILLSLKIAIVILAFITILGFITTIGCLGILLHIHTSIPSDVQSVIEDARKRADDEPHGSQTMSEQEAIDELKEQYAEGDITQRELEQRIDRVFETENPERVVEKEREY